MISIKTFFIIKVRFLSVKDTNSIISHYSRMTKRYLYEEVVTFNCDYARTFFLFFLISLSHDVLMMFLFHGDFISPVFFFFFVFNLRFYRKRKHERHVITSFVCLPDVSIYFHFSVFF